MKKIMFALAALIAMAVSAGSASAQVVATAPTGGCSTCAQGTPSYAGAYGQAYPTAGYPTYAGHGHSLGLPHLGGHMHNPTYGLHPAFSRIADSHRTLFDRIAGVGGRQVPTGPTMEAAQGGTLVFPQNPYIRSPRDFFMWEAK